MRPEKTLRKPSRPSRNMQRSGKWRPTYLTYLIQMSPLECFLVARFCKSKILGHYARLEYLLIEVPQSFALCLRVLQGKVSSHSEYRTSCGSCVDRRNICALHWRSISGVYKPYDRHWRILLSIGLKPLRIRRCAATTISSFFFGTRYRSLVLVVPSRHSNAVIYLC